MTKIIGACLIMFAATMLGVVQASQYARRPKQIRELISALQKLETEIMYGFTPLPQALARIGESMEMPTSALFSEAARRLSGQDGLTTSQVWRDAIKLIWPGTAMGKNERTALLNFGESLGLSDREDQIKHIRLAMDQLKSEEHRAREEQKRYEKMWRSLGVLGGLLVVIVLF